MSYQGSFEFPAITTTFIYSFGFNLSFVICTVSYPFYEQTLLCYLLPIVTADIITIPLRNKIKSNLSQAKREGRSHSWPKRSKLGERETGAGCRGRKGALIRASHCGEAAGRVRFVFFRVTKLIKTKR